MTTGYATTPLDALQCKLAALGTASQGQEEHQRHYRRALQENELFLWAGHTAAQVLTASETYPLDPHAPYLQTPDNVERLPTTGQMIMRQHTPLIVPRLAMSFLVFDAPVAPMPPDDVSAPLSALVIAARFNIVDDPTTPHRHYRFYGLRWNGGAFATKVFSVRWPPTQREQEHVYDNPAYVNTLMRFFLTASQFVDQRICVETTAPLNRAGRKLASRASVSPVVHTIQLRAREAQAHEGGDGTSDYHCRWIVRGHWRNQYYAKTSDHRPVFIEPYVKGPEDQPLKTPKPDVFVVNR